MPGASRSPRILLVEDWSSHIYAEPFYRRFLELGVEAYPFKESSYFARDRRSGLVPLIASLTARAQRKYRWGPSLRALNRDLLAVAAQLRVEVAFFFRGDLIFPSTLRRLKQRGIYLVGWQNDDPFSDRYPLYAWRHFRGSVPLYDRLFAYRHANLEDFRSHGCQRVALLRSFYLRELNHPVGSNEPAIRSDVSFIGHWEPDGRDRHITALLGEREIDFKLWGTLWGRSPIAAALKARFGEIRPLYRESYNLALNGTHVALVFLSTLNRDTYTRRCFEITAAGTFMLSQFSDDLASLFKPGVEADYFSTTEELVEKTKFYLRHDDVRSRIAAAGRRRLLNDGHEAMDRARSVLRHISEDMA